MPRRGNWGRSSEASFERRDSFRDRTHSAGEEGGEPCALEGRCAERDYQGKAKRGPRAFCETDTRYLAWAIGDLPGDYVRLWLMLPRCEQASERVSGSKEPPLPLAADVQAFMREIVHVACSWEEAVRRAQQLSDYPDGGVLGGEVAGSGRRDPVALRDACNTLVTHLSTLLALGTESVTRFVSPATLARLEDESVLDDPLAVRWDTAGDAWWYKPMDGTEAALELSALHGRARGITGLSPGRRRITEVRCDGCNGKTLVQREARAGGLEPVVRCTTCPHTYYGDRFTLLMGRVYEAQVAALNEAEIKRRHATAA